MPGLSIQRKAWQACRAASLVIYLSGIHAGGPGHITKTCRAARTHARSSAGHYGNLRQLSLPRIGHVEVPGTWAGTEPHES